MEVERRAAGRRRPGTRRARRRRRRIKTAGAGQIADEIRAHIGRLDAGAQATFDGAWAPRAHDARGPGEAVREAAADYAQGGDADVAKLWLGCVCACLLLLWWCRAPAGRAVRIQ